MNFETIFSKKQLTLIVKTTILVLATYIIFKKMGIAKVSINSLNISALTVLLTLSFLNWSLEIKKWQLLVSSFKKINFNTSATQSLIAHTTAITTPNKIGEYGAKALLFNKKNRKKIVGLTFLGNAYQLAVTVAFGLLGSFYYLQNTNKLPFNITEIFIGFSMIVSIFLFSIYRSKTLEKIKKFLRKITIKTQLTVLFYCFLRYLLFSFQYYYTLQILGAENAFTSTIPLIWLMYFISSCIPSFSLADFVVKGSVALVIFQGTGIDEVTIATTALLMWIFNYAVPAIIGGFLIVCYKPENQLGYDAK